MNYNEFPLRSTRKTQRCCVLQWIHYVHAENSPPAYVPWENSVETPFRKHKNCAGGGGMNIFEELSRTCHF